LGDIDEASGGEMKALIKTICIAVIFQTTILSMLFIVFAYNAVRDQFPPREIGISATDLVKVGDFRQTVCWECHKGHLQY
jgi:hypothetical protein